MSCIIVMGCYRSGTSAIAGVLQKLGVFMGERFQVPNAGNPRGYFEDLDFMHHHVKMVETIWDEKEEYDELIKKREQEHDLWGIKDPRMCIVFNEFVSRLTCDHKVVCIKRDRYDICESMARSVGYSEPGFWKPIVDFYMDQMEENLSLYNNPILYLEHRDVVENPGVIVGALSSFIDLPIKQEALEFLTCPNSLNTLAQ